MKNNKDLMVSVIANYGPDKIRNYVSSLNRSGFSGDKIMIVYNVPDETVQYLQSNGFGVYVGELRGHPHMQRLIDIYALLKQLDEAYRFIITTDVRDVVFQTNPSDYLENNLKNGLLVSSENVLYKNEPWGIKNILEGYNELLLQRYEGEVSCNVGVIAGRSEYVMDLLLLNYLVSQAGNTQHFTDQSSFNFVIHNRLIKDKIQIEGNETHWALQVGTLNNKDIIRGCQIEIQNELILNNNIPFCIVHQYDRNPQLKQLIEKKYA